MSYCSDRIEMLEFSDQAKKFHNSKDICTYLDWDAQATAFDFPHIGSVMEMD